MPYFKIIKGPTPGVILPLSGKSATIGRSADCEITLSVPAVSRRHARYYIDTNGRSLLEDLKSRNGTSVNNVRLTEPTELHDGDTVQLCDIVLTYHVGPSTQAQLEAVKIIDTANKRLNVESSLPMHGSFGMHVAEAVVPSNLEDKSDSHVRLNSNRLHPPKREDSRWSSSIPQLASIDDEDKSSILSSISVAQYSSDDQSESHATIKLKAILQLMKNLGQNLNLDEVMEKILDSLFVIFPDADDGLIVLLDDDSKRLVPTAVKHRYPTAEPIHISRTVFRKVIGGKTAILSADLLNDDRFNAAQSIVNLSCRSMICAPLIDAEGNALGAIKLDTDELDKRFKQDDLELLVSVAVQAAMYVRNAQLHVLAMKEVALDEELKMAHRIQKALLPDKPPIVEGYNFYDVYMPARRLGGDYYDYFPLPDGRMAIIQADVSGKGITASLLMAKLCADVRFSLMTTNNPIEAVSLLNQIVCSKDLDGKFITLVLVLLDSERNSVTIVNAGHNPPISRKADGTMELIQLNGGLPLGVSDVIPYESIERSIDPGECLFFYTDGLTDAVNENDEFFGINRALKKMSQPADNAAQCGSSLVAYLKEYIGSAKQTDDICIVGFQRSGEKT